MKTAIEILRSLKFVTCGMQNNLNDPDFLIEGINTREKLAQEFNIIKNAKPDIFYTDDAEKLEANDILAAVADMDKHISQAIMNHQKELKAKLADNKARRKVLNYNYSNQAGISHMDYRK